MPELPEMQALAERVADAFAGAKVERIQVIQFSGLKTFEEAPEELYGQTLRTVDRRGKYLVFGFDELRMLVHLSQGGRVDFETPPKATRPKMGVARFVFDNASAMLVKEFGTERKAGWWLLGPDDPGPLEKLGPEPMSSGFGELILEGQDNRRIHTLLRDQRTVAGIGRGYSDEILHEAKLSPYATLTSLDERQRRRLIDATRVALERGLGLERKRVGGLPTKLSDRFQIHGHSGDPCPRCGEEMKRVSYESHEVTYCPNCQTGGKVLADRRMSRLLK